MKSGLEYFHSNQYLSKPKRNSHGYKSGWTVFARLQFPVEGKSNRGLKSVIDCVSTLYSLFLDAVED